MSLLTDILAYPARRAQLAVERQRARLEEENLYRMQLENAEESIRMLETSRAHLDDDTGWIVHGLARPSRGELDLTDLRTLQDNAYQMYKTNPHARAVIRGLSKYIIGKGAIVDHMDDRGEVRDYWKRFVLANDWVRKQKELVVRAIRDGEEFVFFKRNRTKGESTILLRFIEPFEIGPKETNEPTFGVYTAENDVETIVAYNRIIKKEGKILRHERVSVKDLLHFKLNCDSTDKRGIPVLEPVIRDIKKYEQWLADRIILNKARNAIALVKRYRTVPEKLSSLRSEYKATSQLTDRDKQQKMLEPGTVIHATQGVEYDFLSPNLDARDVAADGRAILLAVAAGAGLPEYLVTGNAENANYCVDASCTEALTDRGWLRWNEITLNDKVGTINPRTHKLEYQHPSEIPVFNYEGEMIHINSTHNFDISVTPNHRMYLTTKQFRRRGGRKGKLYVEGIKPWRFERAGDLSGYYYLLPAGTSGFDGEKPETFVLPGIERKTHGFKKPRKIPMKLWLEFLGYFISEGWILNNGSDRYYIGLGQKKGKMADKIRECLEQLPFNWSESQRDKANKEMISWRAFDKALWTWLKENVRAGAKNKRIPEFVNSLDSELLHVLVDALVDGDGHKKKNGSRYYYTISEQLADDVTVLALKAGFVTGAQKPMKNGVIPVKIRNSRQFLQLSPKRHVSKEHYKGKVWCVVVPNGLFITRRNGKVAITGNSSTLIAESPGVREFEDYQSIFGSLFRQIYREVMTLGLETGDIPPLPEGEYEGGTPPTLEAQFIFPAMIHRDYHRDNQALQIQHNEGIISTKTWREKMDLDHDNEEMNLAAERRDIYDLDTEL